MGLIEQINSDTIAVMKSGDKVALSVLRMLKSDLKYKQIELNQKLTDEDCLDVLSSAAKKCRDAIREYGKAGRDDLAAKEKAELEIIKNICLSKFLTRRLKGSSKKRSLKRRRQHPLKLAWS